MHAPRPKWTKLVAWSSLMATEYGRLHNRGAVELKKEFKKVSAQLPPGDEAQPLKRADLKEITGKLYDTPKMLREYYGDCCQPPVTTLEDFPDIPQPAKDRLAAACVEIVARYNSQWSVFVKANRHHSSGS